jgi:TolB-like protein/Tfp pilus assembly protein PilF
MKKCPQCGREYDVSMSFCLDDGSELLYGPGSEPTPFQGGQSDEPPTAILHETASPGEAATRAQIHSTEQTSVLPSGVPGTKGFDKRLLVGSILVAVVAIGGFIAYRYASLSATGQINSIAVLPFQNRSGDNDSDYLSDGIAESLIYRLSQLPNLKVSPASAVMRYKGKEFDAQKIAAELGVQAVMSGRMMQRGDNLSISVELIDAANNKTIWGEQYEKKMSDLLATQREIAASIVDKLQLKLSGSEATGITKKYTDSSEAYQLYLKGRFQWNKRTAESLKAAETIYKQAIGQDPTFALAYSALAETYALFPNYSVESARESGPKAKAAATKAIEIDPTLAEPHAALGGYHQIYTWDLETAVRELQRATELNPKYATAHHWLGVALTGLGKCDEAITAARRAEELDPLSVIISADVALNLIYCRRFDDSLAQTERTLKLDPGFYYTHYLAGWAHLNKGNYPAALAAFRRSRELNSDPFATSLFIQALAKAGERADAVKLHDELRSAAGRQYIDPYVLAIAEIGMGEKDAAFRLLERTVTERGWYATYITSDPAMDDLREDPRFPALVKKLQTSRLE